MKVLSSRSAVVEALDHVAAQPPGIPFAITSPAGKVVLLGSRLSQADTLDPKSLGRIGGLQLAQAWLPPLGVQPVAAGSQFAGSRDSSGSEKPITAQVAKFIATPAATTTSPAGPTVPVHDVITLGGGGLNLYAGAAMPAQRKAVFPNNVTYVAPSTGFVVNPFADPKRASEVIGYVSEGVDLVSKLAPDLAGPLGVAGNVLDGFAIITNGAGILDAIQKKDGQALAGYSLTMGVSVFGLLGSFTGNPNLQNVALVLKLADSSMTILSNQKAK